MGVALIQGFVIFSTGLNPILLVYSCWVEGERVRRPILGIDDKSSNHDSLNQGFGESQFLKPWLVQETFRWIMIPWMTISWARFPWTRSGRTKFMRLSTKGAMSSHTTSCISLSMSALSRSSRTCTHMCIYLTTFLCWYSCRLHIIVVRHNSWCK